MSIFYLIISFCTSLVGAICGIGGGVIIKPTLDFLALADAATVSFLSGCTVLAMSTYNVTKGIMAKESKVDFSTATPLAIGASIGGVIGKQIFSAIKANAANPAFVGKVQAFCLMCVTIGTYLYMVFRSKIKTNRVKGNLPSAVIGIVLGIMSSFLGIGGGPCDHIDTFFTDCVGFAVADGDLFRASQICCLCKIPVRKQVSCVQRAAAGCGGTAGSCHLVDSCFIIGFCHFLYLF